MLETIASDPGLQQAELVFLGLFGRACRILDSRDSQVRYARRSIPQIRHALAISPNSWAGFKLHGQTCAAHIRCPSRQA